MTQWWPTPEQERWLEVGGRFRTVPRDEVTRRAGGWRAVGPFARIALFGLGAVSAGLMLVILGVQRPYMLLVDGVVAVAIAEWLKVSRRLHASGFEEGLAAAGWLLVAFWFVSRLARPGAQPELMLLFGGGAAALAGLRSLNPFLTACAAVAWLHWSDSTAPARLLDSGAGGGAFAFVTGCVGAVIALAAAARPFRRPSYDHMLDWLVVVLPIAGYLHRNAGDTWHRAAITTHLAQAHAVTALILAGLALAMVAIALRRRQHAPLLAGLGCTACAVVELTRLVAWPIEGWLIVTGLVAITLTALVDRRLRTVRHGVTSVRIQTGESVVDLLQTAGTAIVTPRIGEPAREVETAPADDGGRFGGGGASGSY